MLLYFVGIIIPPLAILLYGKIIPAALNGIIWTYAIITPDLTGSLAWVCASFHASYMIYRARSDGLMGRQTHF